MNYSEGMLLKLLADVSLIWNHLLNVDLKNVFSFWGRRKKTGPIMEPGIFTG